MKEVGNLKRGFKKKGREESNNAYTHGIHVWYISLHLA